MKKGEKMKINKTSLDTLCGALCKVMGVEPPEKSAAPCSELIEYANNVFSGNFADKIFMYNPDAIAQWIYEIYPHFVKKVSDRTDLKIPFCTVMPSVTPVCFGTMYTGAQPAVHGIQSYVKPVIAIDTLFDAMIRAGKKCAIVSTTNDSMSKIFLEREMDYFIYDTTEEVNAKASELIIEDSHDFIAVYNGNYDSTMHKYGPESIEALGELRANAETYATFDVLIQKYWTKHNCLIGFAMDHGCHEIDGDCGSHGLDMPEDLNIVHCYKAYPANK